MTTTSIGCMIAGLAPPPAGQPSGQPATSGSTGDAFLALVQGLLDGAAAQPATGELAVPGATRDVTDPLDIAGTPGEESIAEGTAPVVDTMTPLPDLTTAAMIVPALMPVAVQAQPGLEAQASAAAVAAPVATVAAPVPGEAPATASPADPSAPSAPGAELPDVAVARTEHRPATSGEQGGASVAPVTGTTPLTSTAAPTTADTHRVTQQVFPEVVRVVTNPDGLSRVTIKLNPEALGEVRVVLTSRNGGLEVSLAAGSDARAALTEGAPELQRLLESVGRGDSRIVVRDLIGATVGTTVSTHQPTAATSGSGVPTDLAGGAGTGTGRPGGDTAADQQSRNHAPGNSSAMHGAQGTTDPSRPTESVTRAHPGLDVTM